jgi:predicted nucleotidyltransferase
MEAAIKDHLPEIKNLLRRYSVESAYLFGSAAKNVVHQNSDVDFLIRFRNDLDYETYSDNYFGLLYSLQALLQKNVDLIAEETLSNPYLIQSINQSKIRLL